jgi:hypothetical protein
MKKIAVFTLIFTNTLASASILTCTTTNAVRSAKTLHKQITGTCNIRNPLSLQIEDTLNFELSDVELGLRTSGLKTFLLTCPQSEKEDLLANVYKGKKVTPMLLMGAEFGIFRSEAGKACLLTGLTNQSVINKITGSELKFTE